MNLLKTSILTITVLFNLNVFTSDLASYQKGLSEEQAQKIAMQAALTTGHRLTPAAYEQIISAMCFLVKPASATEELDMLVYRTTLGFYIDESSKKQSK